MKNQLSKGTKTYLHLQILRKMKNNPEFKKKVIAMAEKNKSQLLIEAHKANHGKTLEVSKKKQKAESEALKGGNKE